MRKRKKLFIDAQMELINPTVKGLRESFAICQELVTERGLRGK